MSLVLFFSLGEVNQAVKCVEQIKQYVTFEGIKSDRVKFDYYAGRVYLYFHQFSRAETHLLNSFQRCLPVFSNKR